MKAKVDEGLCCGAGPCQEICPEVFKRIDGVSVVQVETVPSEVEKKCQEAMEECPTNAISLK
jgi:ferredoxin